MPDYTKFAYTFDHFADLVDGLLDQLRITLARSYSEAVKVTYIQLKRS